MNTAAKLPLGQLDAPSRADTAEARLALRIAGRLNEGAGALPHDISERLRFARQQALNQAQAQRRHAAAAASAPVAVGARQAALAGPPSWWLRLASTLPLLLLLAGLVLIQQQRDQEQIAVAAEIDSGLLTDALPPEAYGDPGFSEYLQGTPGQ